MPSRTPAPRCELLPQHTLYFHDVDLLPGPHFQGYPLAEQGAVRHLYGHRHCLGGIIAMRLDTYRRVGGFRRDKWTWGGEDTDLQKRVLLSGVAIVRSPFTLRYQNDAIMLELDDHGVPMTGREARSHFLERYEQRKAAPALVADHGELSFSAYGHLHKPDTGLIHVVYE